MDKKVVLIVDDDEELLKALKLRIERDGYEFMSAQDGEEMFNVMEVKKPDVILLDIMLPKKDGYSALREMRTKENFKNIPVIVLSAKEEKALGDLFALEKVAYFVEKPCDMEDLLQKIRGLVDG